MRNPARKTIAFAVTACLVLSGAPASFARADDLSIPKAVVTSSITVNKIKFEVMKDGQLPVNIKSKIDQLKLKKGYQPFAISGGGYYVLISSGEKPSGGYGIEVLSVEDNEGKTNILVRESSPKPDDIVTTVITHPYVAIKIAGVTDNFNIKNEAGEAFKMLEFTPVKATVVKKAVGSYTGRIDGNSIEIKVNGKPMALQIGKLKKTIDKLRLKKGSKVSFSWQANENGQNILLSLKIVK